MIPVSLSILEDTALQHLQNSAIVDGDRSALIGFDARRGLESLNQFPAVCAAVESIAFRVVDESTIEWSPTLVLYLVFKNVSNETDRRKGAYPILEGAVRLLQCQTLGLEIEPLIPGQADEIINPSLERRGLVGFKVPFTTSFDVAKYIEQEEAVRFIVSGVKYYLQPDNQLVAQDEINL